MAKIRRYSARLSRIIVLLFNTLMTKHNFLRLLKKKLEKLPFFSATHKITYIAGYTLSRRKGYVYTNVGTFLVLVHVHCRDFNIFNSHGLLPSDLVAQSVERRRSNPKVVGSIPTLVRVFLCPCVGPFPSVGLTLSWFIWDISLALHISLYSVNSIR